MGHPAASARATHPSTPAMRLECHSWSRHACQQTDVTITQQYIKQTFKPLWQIRSSSQSAVCHTDKGLI